MHNPQDDASRVDAVVCSKDRSCIAEKLLGTLSSKYLWSTAYKHLFHCQCCPGRKRGTETRTQAQPVHKNALRAGWADVQLQMHV